MNVQCTTAINLNVCLKVLFMGVKINYAKELMLDFEEYVEVYGETDKYSEESFNPMHCAVSL